MNLSAAARALKLTNKDVESEFNSFMRNKTADHNQQRLKHIRSKVVQVYGIGGSKQGKAAAVPKQKIEIEAIIETEKKMQSKKQSSIMSGADEEKFFDRAKTTQQCYTDKRVDNKAGPNINVFGSQTKLQVKPKAADRKLPTIQHQPPRKGQSSGQDYPKRGSSSLGLLQKF